MTEHEKAWRAEYAKTLRVLMRRKKISIRGLAEELGISRSAVGQYVSGECLPNAYIAARIIELLK